jgi:hypothetical protein
MVNNLPQQAALLTIHNSPFTIGAVFEPQKTLPGLK